MVPWFPPPIGGNHEPEPYSEPFIRRQATSDREPYGNHSGRRRRGRQRGPAMTSTRVKPTTPYRRIKTSTDPEASETFAVDLVIARICHRGLGGGLPRRPVTIRFASMGGF